MTMFADAKAPETKRSPVCTAGVTTTEYALMLSLIVAAVIGIVLSIATATQRMTSQHAALSNSMPATYHQGTSDPTPGD